MDNGSFAILGKKIKDINSQLLDIELSVKTFGAKGDGIHDDTIPINLATAYVGLVGRGYVVFPPGIYKTTSSIYVKNNTSIIGRGYTNTTIMPYGTGFAAIQGLGSIANPFVDIEIADFKIDCTHIVDATYNIASKAIFMTYLIRCQFRNLYLYNVPASALGIDFLQDCVIDNCIVDHAGRQFDGSIGSNCIGIGTGRFLEESVTISDCHVLNSGNNGIMFEKQPYYNDDNPVVVSGHMKVIGCTARNCLTGFRDSGDVKVEFIGCSSMKNTGNGFIIANGLDGIPGKELIVSDCIITDNGAQGINIAGVANPESNLNIHHNIIGNNAGYGVNSSIPIGNVKVNFNQVYKNGLTGINFGDARDYVSIDNNDVYNNGLLGTANQNDGIVIDGANVKYLSIKANNCYDNQTTKKQNYGIHLKSAVVNSVVEDNNVAGNATGSIVNVASTTLTIRNNQGFNPIGASAVTVTASPFTYTASYTDETLYISGGAVSSITKSGGVVIATSSNIAIQLEPHKAVSITYSTLPTIISDKH